MPTVTGTSLENYRHLLGLATDQYQLTMGQGYHDADLFEAPCEFAYMFRSAPFNGGYATFAGSAYTAYFLEYLRENGLSAKNIDFLRTIKGRDGAPIFRDDFLQYLEAADWRLSMGAMDEGLPVFPFEPSTVISGQLGQVQFVETFLLLYQNFQTLIATKASRIREAAGEAILSEQGFRRAQGMDGALSASRAAYIGGFDSTSNLAAGFQFDIPTAGTMAHAFVMAFPNEIEAFKQFAKSLPNNTLFLIDTFDTIQGAKNAAQVGKWLKEQGHHLFGVRLDSGDLTWLSIRVRKILDEAGLQQTKIFGSNDLDEVVISDLKAQGSIFDSWGVGTQVVTGGKYSALGGVFKLAWLGPEDSELGYRIKLSEDRDKTSIPGRLQLRRFFKDGMMLGDAVYDRGMGIESEPRLVSPIDQSKWYVMRGYDRYEDVLRPVVVEGVYVGANDSLYTIRERAMVERRRLDPSHLRLAKPHPYKVSLESRLAALRQSMIDQYQAKAVA